MTTEKIRRTLQAVTLLVLCGALPSAMASGLQARVSARQLALGESFTLMLSVDTATPGVTPDLAPLKDHFQILGVSQQSSTNITNGQRSEAFSWLVSLAPKDKGKLTIPSLAAGPRSSDPLTVEVLDRTAVAGNTSAGTVSGGLRIDISVDPGTHYVQQEIPVTVRIHGGAGLREARLIEPSGDDFVLTQSGEDQTRQITQNGRPSQVIERHYVLKAQKSGKMTLPPLTLVATVNDPSSPSSPFANMGIPGGISRSMFGSSLFRDFFNQGREITVRSQPVTLDLKPRPTGDSVWFLPAKRVELKAQWANDQPQFRVGEAMTRTIQLLALGASKEQLPDIPMVNPTGARLYLERSNDKSIDTAQGTVALREFVVSVVPTQVGDVSLPSIEVHWWDTGSDTERVATLPAQTIHVAAGSAAASQTPLAKMPASAPTSESVHLSDPLQQPPRSFTSAQIVTIGLAALLFLVVLGAAMAKRRMARRSSDSTSHSRLNPNGQRTSDHNQTLRAEIVQSELAFVQACKANDLRAAYSALSVWLRNVHSGPFSTAGQADGEPFELLVELAAMEEQLYAGKPNMAWKAERVLSVFNKEKRALAKPHPARNEHNLVPALYPG